MLTTPNRFIVWFCIIAHLNLVLPLFQPAHASSLQEGWQEAQKRHSPPIKDPDALKKPSSFGSSLWESEILSIGLLSCAASVLYDVDPIACALSCIFLNKLLKFVPSDWTQFLAFSLLPAIVSASSQSPTINGGRYKEIPCKPGMIGYDNSSAPWVDGVDPKQTLFVSIDSTLFDTNDTTFYPYNIIKYMMNSTANVTLRNWDNGWVFVSGTAENLKDYLIHLTKYPVSSTFIALRQDFNYYNDSDLRHQFAYAWRSLYLTKDDPNYWWVAVGVPCVLTAIVVGCLAYCNLKQHHQYVPIGSGKTEEMSVLK